MQWIWNTTFKKKKKKDSKRIREMEDFLNKEIIILLIKKYQTTIWNSNKRTFYGQRETL